MHLALFPAHGKRARARSMTAGRNVPVTLCVTISVDTGQPQTASAPGTQQQLHDAFSSLHALCGELGLPATWGIREPFNSPLVQRMHSRPHGRRSHEVAVRLAPRWSSPISRRMILADALTRCARHAEAAGLEITTIFADESLLAGNYDLVVKRGITSIRLLRTRHSAGTRTPAGPRPLRYGLWGYPISCSLPAHRALASRRVHERLADGPRKSGSSSHGVLHVAIDASRLIADDRRTWRVVEKSLRLLARLRQEGAVHIEPLRSVTARLNRVPAAAPQRSILRRAA